jgi:group I intron endonuclease
MSKPGAYVLTDIVTGRFYVGSSQDIDKRIASHFKCLTAGNHHNVNLMQLYPTSRGFHINRFPTTTRAEAFLLEQDILDRYATSPLLLNIGKSVFGGDNLTNHPNRDDIILRMKATLNHQMILMSTLERKILYGKHGDRNGMYGRTHTAEARAKISACNLGITRRSGFKCSDEHKAKMSEHAKLRIGAKNPFYGKQHTQVTKDKLAAGMRERGLLPTNSRSVSVDGNIYPSLTEASRQLEISPALMVYRLNSVKPKYSQYVYVNECPTTKESTLG